MKSGQRNDFFEILITIVLGLIVGILTFGFIKALTYIEFFHDKMNQGVPYHLLLIPLVIIIIELTKKNVLYFPLKTSQISEESSSHYWTVFMMPFQYFGTLLCHFSGVSVGRESAVVLFSAGLVRLFRLSWGMWGPITGAIGFSAVIGQFWVAPFFMTELFGRTTVYQKIYAFMGAVVAVLLIRTLGGHQLFEHIQDTTQMGFFNKLIFFFMFAGCAGYLMRIYKKFYFLLSDYFKNRSLWVKVLIAAVLMIFLSLPEFRRYQSLGISQFSDLAALSGGFLVVITKLFFTLISTTVGFFGGEFIPLVYSGVYYGYSFFGFFGHNPMLGAVLGAYLLFAGATRFKWTGYILILNLMGFSWWFWAYFLAATASGFSGQQSIYKKEIKY